MMSLRQWELKIHLRLSLVLKSLAWILFPAYLKPNYLWDLCCCSPGTAVLLPPVHSDPFWPKRTRSHKAQDGASWCSCWLDPLTLTFVLPTYWNSLPLEPRFPNHYLDSCLTASCVATCFYCCFTGFFTLSFLSINKVLRQPTKLFHQFTTSKSIIFFSTVFFQLSHRHVCSLHCIHFIRAFSHFEKATGSISMCNPRGTTHHQETSHTFASSRAWPYCITLVVFTLTLKPRWRFYTSLLRQD